MSKRSDIIDGNRAVTEKYGLVYTELLGWIDLGLGFYRVISNYDPLLMLRPVSKEDALARWDYYGKIGNWKNKKFQPLLFPDPKKKYPPAAFPWRTS
ncbi:hypothetical protein [Rosenbergiella epipactidis]|uniref:hypothetical protein n=1 Tax=Rosenbergiella epipactidis TaxID=1544694 RepID=UPI0030C80582